MKFKIIFIFFVSIALFSVPTASNAQTYSPYAHAYFNYDSWMYQNPQVSWCGGYYGACQIGTQHVFAPYTYVASPVVSIAAYQYPTQTYSYPQYQTGYSQSNYYQSSYPRSYYQDYGYSGAPNYSQFYMSGGEYCYSGYGCYPFYVEDPHQWVYDQWTGTWY